MKLVGHRGVRALSPENTLPSFQLAVDYNLDGIETDVWMTKDGELVLIHDATVDRTTDGSGRVTEMTLAELRRLDAGAHFASNFKNVRIPLLSEFLDLVKDNEILLNIELKDYRREALNKTIAMVEAHGLRDRIVITSFSPDVTTWAVKDHKLRTQGFPPASYGENYNEAVYDEMYAVGIPMNELTKELVDHYTVRGIEAWCWCPDTDEAVRQAIASGAVLATVNDPRPALRILKGEGQS